MPGLAAEIEVLDPTPDPESGFAQEQSAARLTQAIHGLPVAYRQVVTLTLEGLGYAEIAKVLGISESNVGVRLTRARQMLRELLEAVDEPRRRVRCLVWFDGRQQPDTILLAAATWFFLAAAWTIALTFSHVNWSPSALDTIAFVDLSVLRCRGTLAAIRFVAGLFVYEIVFCLGWVYRQSPEPRTPLLPWLLFSSPRIDIVWLTTLLFFGFPIWYRRRNRAEMTYLVSLSEQFKDSPPDER